MPSFRRRASVIDADRVDEPPQDPGKSADAAEALSLAEEAEAEAAEAEAIAAAAREPLEIAIPGGVPVIVSAGRLAEAKNWPLLIDALQWLKQELAFHAILLGQGELEPEIRRRIDAAGLAGDVTLCGFQSNPWKFMARGDVFVLTSHYEGFGNVLVEAMACGTPVVATASPGTRAIVESGSNGILVEQHDARSVADALALVLRDRGLRDRLRGAARVSAEGYDAGAIAGAYDRLLQQVAG